MSKRRKRFWHHKYDDNHFCTYHAHLIRLISLLMHIIRNRHTIYRMVQPHNIVAFWLNLSQYHGLLCDIKWYSKIQSVLILVQLQLYDVSIRKLDLFCCNTRYTLMSGKTRGHLIYFYLNYLQLSRKAIILTEAFIYLQQTAVLLQGHLKI